MLENYSEAHLIQFGAHSSFSCISRHQHRAMPETNSESNTIFELKQKNDQKASI